MPFVCPILDILRAIARYGVILGLGAVLTLLHVGVLAPHAETPAILDLRLPIAAVALLAGYALGMAGLLIQSLTQNPLASPSILGMTSGAALAIAASMATGLHLGSNLPYISAFLGAFLSGALVLFIAGWRGPSQNSSRLVLSGAIVTALLGSLTQVLILTHEDMSDHMLYWMVGGLDQAHSSQILPLTLLLLVALATQLLFARRLDIITIDENIAWSLGVPVAQTKTILILLAVTLVAAAVSVVGPIGFVGFVAPHTARFLGFRTHKHLAFASGLIGGVLLVGADYGSSILTHPYQSPAGLLTGAFGAVLFLLLIMIRSARGHL